MEMCAPKIKIRKSLELFGFCTDKNAIVLGAFICMYGCVTLASEKVLNYSSTTNIFLYWEH